MTITLKPKTEQALQEAAARRGVTPDQLIEESLQTGPLLELMEDMNAEERERRRQEALARIKSGYYAKLLGSSEEFIVRKSKERALEEKHVRNC